MIDDDDDDDDVPVCSALYTT